MKVRLYSISKRINSTLRPSGLYDERECRLKTPTSVERPTIELAGTLDVDYNYAYIDEFKRCYFVSDYRSIANGIFQLDLEEDYLATHKTDIQASKAFVAFSSDSSVYDVYKVDPRIASSQIRAVSSNTDLLQMLNDTGCYILTVFNNSPIADSVGFGVSYMLNKTNMGKVREWLGDGSIMSSLVSYFGGTALESIFGCVWVPYAYTESDATLGSVVNNVLIGNHSSTVDGYSITAVRLNGYITKSESLSISLLGMLRDDFRRCEPYTSASLYLPGPGVIELNLSDWVTAQEIQISAIFELPTGNILYMLRDPNGYIIQTASACLAAQCPLGQMTTNISGAVNSVVGMAAGAVSLAAGVVNPVLAGGALLASGASAVLNYNRRAPSISGSVGGRLSSIQNLVELTLYEVQTEDPANADFVALKGRPVGKVCTLGNLSGYIQCDGATVSVGGSATERDEVNRLLNEGFFLE